MGNEVPKLENLISPYADEVVINGKLCKIKKMSMRRRIEVVKEGEAIQNAEADGSDFAGGLERMISLADEVTHGVDRSDIEELDFEQINWIISRATGRTSIIEQPIDQKKGRKGRKGKN